MKGEGLVSVNIDFIIRIGVAGLLGAIIGIEREIRSKEAGLKHISSSGRKCFNNGRFEICFSDIMNEDHMALDESYCSASC